MPQIQFFDSGWLFLLCGQRRVLTVLTVQPIVEILQVPFLDRLFTCPLLCNVVHSSGLQAVDISCRGAEADSYGPSFQKKT